MDSPRKRSDTTIAIIVIIAGLATGAVITWFPHPRPQPVYEPQYRVVGSMAEAEALGRVGAEPIAPDAPGTGDVPSAEPPTDDEAQIVEETGQQLEQAGVTETVELTEELYVRLSAEVVLMANALKDHPDVEDTQKMQDLLADFTTNLLAENHVDGQDFLDFSRWAADDYDRARRIGELILREAEKHAKMRITVHDVPGVAPAPVAPPD